MDYEFIDINEHVILFLHGFGGNKESFNVVKGRLENSGLCFITFSGFDGKESLEKPYCVQDYANELKCFIDKILVNKKISVVCHSFGARVAVLLATKFDLKINKTALSTLLRRESLIFVAILKR